LLKLARRGKPEPDPRVAEIGVAWAEAMLIRRAEPPSSRPERVLGFLLSLVTADFDAEGVGQRWIAGRVLQANRPIDWELSGKPLMQDEAVRQAVRTWLLDELQFRVGAQPLTIEPDRLSDLADNLADVTVGRFEVNPPSGPPVKQGQLVWVKVHAVMLGELESRANSRPLTIEPDRLDDFAAQLADVVVGRFEVTPRAERER
jgi:hypothetical protein